MNRKTISGAICILLISIPIQIQAQLKIDAQLRNRFEIRNGYQKLAEKETVPAFLIWQRTRISVSYETEHLKLKVTPQDVRLWGDEAIRSSTGVLGDEASLEIFESYAEIRLGNAGWLSVGRQQFKYDNERILGARNWNNRGLTYDAVLLKLKTRSWNIHLGSTWNSIAEASSDNIYPANRIKSLNYLWLNHQVQDHANLSLLHVASGITETDTTNGMNFRQTTGLYIEYHKQNLNMWGDAYYQYGRNQSRQHISAFLIGADFSYQTRNFIPGFGLVYLSGNNKTGTDQTTDKLFDILYGRRHSFYGFIDYFRDFPSHTLEGGLIDYYFNLGYTISKSLIIQNTGHYFQLAQTNPLTPENRKLGYENDLVLKCKFSDWGTLETGYLFFLSTKSLKTIQQVPDSEFSQFFYLQLTLNPVLLNKTTGNKIL